MHQFKETKDVSIIKDNTSSECKHLFFPNIEDLSDADIRSFSAFLLKALNNERGVVLDDTKFELFREAISTELAQNFKYLTVKEVYEQCRNGLRGLYGDYQGVNAIAINKWLTAWINSDKRAMVVDEYQRLKQANIKKLMPYIKSDFDNAIECLEIMWDKPYNELFDGGNIAYNALSKINLIDISTKRKYDILELARLELKKKKETERIGEFDINKKRLLTNIILSLEDSATPALDLAKKITMYEQIQDWKKIFTFEEVSEYLKGKL